MCRSQLGLTDEELARCASASFQHSHAPAGTKERGQAGVAAWLAAGPCRRCNAMHRLTTVVRTVEYVENALRNRWNMWCGIR